MKFWQFGRVVLASTFSLGLALLLNSCGGGYTIAYLYTTGAFDATQSGPTPISVLGINSQTGAVYPVASGTAPMQFTDVVAEAVAPNQKNLYVLAQGVTGGSGPVVVQYSITNNGSNTNGDITPVNSYATTGSLPTGISIDAASAYLYVSETYAANSSTNGDVDVFPINADGTLGTPTAVALANNQNGVAVTALPYTASSSSGACNGSNCYVYVASWNQADINNPNGTITAYQNNGGSLGVIATYAGTGNQLAGIISYSSTIGQYVYVSDKSLNCIYGFNPHSDGTLVGITMGGGTNSCGAFGISTNASTGSSKPTSLLIEPRGKYLFVTNTGANTIGAYLMGQSTGGSLTTVSGGVAITGTQPQCLAIDPILGQFLFTADYLSSVTTGGGVSNGGTVHGYKLNGSTGALVGLQNGPFIVASAYPSCVAVSTTASIPPPGSP
jgi:6-phosphogluconolactonase